MSEIITTYLLSDLDQPLPMERQEFYASQKQLFDNKQKPNRAAAIVQILLFTPDQDVILQKRSADKAHNAGLMDKTIGGHITFGDTSTYTATVETLQEMEVPSIVLGSEEDFAKTFRLLKNFLNNTALVQLVESRTANFTKVIGGQHVPIANKYYFYLGVYGGSVRPADREASGILFYNLAMLRQEIATTPDAFTDDLKFFLTKYHTQIESFLKQIG